MGLAWSENENWSLSEGGSMAKAKWNHGKSSDKWRTIKGNRGFSEGVVSFSVSLVRMGMAMGGHSQKGTELSVSIGVVLKDAVFKNDVGVGLDRDHVGWGFASQTPKVYHMSEAMDYGEKYWEGDEITVTLDFNAKTISFKKNKKDFGVAFTNLHGTVCPAISVKNITGAMVRLTGSMGDASPLQAAVADNNNLLSATWGPGPGWLPGGAWTLSDDENRVATAGYAFNNDTWKALKGKQVYSEGEHMFSVDLLKMPTTDNSWGCSIGVVPKDTELTNQCIGRTNYGWGFVAKTASAYHGSQNKDYGEKYWEGDTIMVLLDFKAKTISFKKNQEAFGVAFRNLTGPVCPAISLTPAGAKVRIRTLQKGTAAASVEEARAATEKLLEAQFKKIAGLKEDEKKEEEKKEEDTKKGHYTNEDDEPSNPEWPPTNVPTCMEFQANRGRTRPETESRRQYNQRTGYYQTRTVTKWTPHSCTASCRRGGVQLMRDIIHDRVSDVKKRLSLDNKYCQDLWKKISQLRAFGSRDHSFLSLARSKEMVELLIKQGSVPVARDVVRARNYEAAEAILKEYKRTSHSKDDMVQKYMPARPPVEFLRLLLYQTVNESILSAVWHYVAQKAPEDLIAELVSVIHDDSDDLLLKTVELVSNSNTQDAFCAALNRLLQAKLDVNRINETGRLFCLVVEAGHENTVRLLIEHKVDVNKTDDKAALAPLFRAKQNVSTLKMLLAAKADPDVLHSTSGKPQMYQLAQSRKPHHLRAMVLAGAVDVTAALLKNSQNDNDLLAFQKGLVDAFRGDRKLPDEYLNKLGPAGLSPLHAALDRGDAAFAEYLVQGWKPDLEFKSSDGRMAVAFYRDPRVTAETQLSSLPKFNKRAGFNYRPTQYGSDVPALAKVFMERNQIDKPANSGTAPDGRTSDKLPALMVARRREVVAFLVSAHADINIKDSTLGRTPLMWAHNLEVATALCDMGARGEGTDKSGLSLGEIVKDPAILELYMKRNKLDGLDALQFGKFSPEEEAKLVGVVMTKYSLQEVVVRQLASVVKQYVQKGADVNKVAHSMSDSLVTVPPLCLAYSAPVAKILLEAGADVNKRGRDPFSSPPLLFLTAVSKAGGYDDYTAFKKGFTFTEEGTLETTKLLLSAKADVNAQDKARKRTAIMMTKYPSVAEALLEAKADTQLADGEGLPVSHVQENTEILRLLLNQNKFDGTAALMHPKTTVQIQRRLLEAGVDINTPDSQGRYVLLERVKQDDANTETAVRELMQAKAQVNVTAPDGRNALMLASSDRVVKALVEGKADLGAKDKQGRSLYEVIDNVKTMKMLLDMGAFDKQAAVLSGKNLDVMVRAKVDLNATDQAGGMTALTAAVQRNRKDVVEALIQAGAKVTSLDKGADRHMAPLHKAVQQSNTAMIKFLLSNGADVNQKTNDYKAPLFFAQGEEEARLLLDARASITDTKGRSGEKLPISQIMSDAALRVLFKDKRMDQQVALLDNANHTEDVRLLKQAGVDLNHKNAQGKTPLHVVAGQSSYKEHLFDALVANGADINPTDTEGNTPLHEALRGNRPAHIVKGLVDAKANVNAKNRQGDVALHLLKGSNQAAYVKMLMDAKADVTVTNSAKQPLSQSVKDKNVMAKLLEHKAIDWRQAAMSGRNLDTLVKAGVKLDTGTSNSPPPLIEAVMENNLVLMKALMDARADPNIDDKRPNGLRPLMHARSKEAVSLLLSHKADPSKLSTKGKHIDEVVKLEPVMRALLVEHKKIDHMQAILRTATSAGGAAHTLERFKLLLQSGVNVNAMGRGEVPADTAFAAAGTWKRNQTALHEVVMTDTPEKHALAQALIENKADVDARAGSETPLMRATYDHSVRLLEAKCDVNAANSKHTTALHVACAMHITKPGSLLKDANKDPVKLLLEHKADPTLKSEVLRNRNDNALSLLLTLGTEFDEKTAKGETPNIKARDEQTARRVMMLYDAAANKSDLLDKPPLLLYVVKGAKEESATKEIETDLNNCQKTLDVLVNVGLFTKKPLTVVDRSLAQLPVHCYAAVKEIQMHRTQTHTWNETFLYVVHAGLPADVLLFMLKYTEIDVDINHSDPYGFTAWHYAKSFYADQDATEVLRTFRARDDAATMPSLRQGFEDDYDDSDDDSTIGEETSQAHPSQRNRGSEFKTQVQEDRAKALAERLSGAGVRETRVRTQQVMAYAALRAYLGKNPGWSPEKEAEQKRLAALAKAQTQNKPRKSVGFLPGMVEKKVAPPPTQAQAQANSGAGGGVTLSVEQATPGVGSKTEQAPPIKLSGHGGAVLCVAVHQDAKLKWTLVAAGAGDTVRTFNTTGKLMSTMKGHSGTVRGVVFVATPGVGTADRLVSGSYSRDRCLMLWNPTASRKLHKAKANFDVTAVCAVPEAKDGAFLVAGEDGNFEKWQVTDKDRLKRLSTFQTDHGGSYRCLCISADGAVAALGVGQSANADSDEDDTDVDVDASGAVPFSVEVWTMNNKARTHTLNGHTGAVNSVAFIGGKSNRVVSCSDDKTLRVWDLSDAKRARCVKVIPLKFVPRAVCSRQGSSTDEVVVGGSGGDMYAYNSSTGARLLSPAFKEHREDVCALAVDVSADTYLVSGCADATALLWKLNDDGDERKQAAQAEEKKVDAAALLKPVDKQNNPGAPNAAVSVSGRGGAAIEQPPPAGSRNNLTVSGMRRSKSRPSAMHKSGSALNVPAPPPVFEYIADEVVMGGDAINTIDWSKYPLNDNSLYALAILLGVNTHIRKVTVGDGVPAAGKGASQIKDLRMERVERMASIRVFGLPTDFVTDAQLKAGRIFARFAPLFGALQYFVDIFQLMSFPFSVRIPWSSDEDPQKAAGGDATSCFLSSAITLVTNSSLNVTTPAPTPAGDGPSTVPYIGGIIDFFIFMQSAVGSVGFMDQFAMALTMALLVLFCFFPAYEFTPDSWIPRRDINRRCLLQRIQAAAHSDQDKKWWETVLFVFALILQGVVWAGTTVLFVPVLKVIISYIDCTDQQQLGWVLDSDPTFRCRTVEWWFGAISCILISIPYAIISFRLTRVGGQAGSCYEIWDNFLTAGFSWGWKTDEKEDDEEEEEENKDAAEKPGSPGSFNSRKQRKELGGPKKSEGLMWQVADQMSNCLSSVMIFDWRKDRLTSHNTHVFSIRDRHWSDVSTGVKIVLLVVSVLATCHELPLAVVYLCASFIMLGVGVTWAAFYNEWLNDLRVALAVTLLFINVLALIVTIGGVNSLLAEHATWTFLLGALPVALFGYRLTTWCKVLDHARRRSGKVAPAGGILSGRGKGKGRSLAARAAGVQDANHPNAGRGVSVGASMNMLALEAGNGGGGGGGGGENEAGDSTERARGHKHTKSLYGQTSTPAAPPGEKVKSGMMKWSAVQRDIIRLANNLYAQLKVPTLPIIMLYTALCLAVAGNGLTQGQIDGVSFLLFCGLLVPVAHILARVYAHTPVRESLVVMAVALTYNTLPLYMSLAITYGDTSSVASSLVSEGRRIMLVSGLSLLIVAIALAWLSMVQWWKLLCALSLIMAQWKQLTQEIRVQSACGGLMAMALSICMIWSSSHASTDSAMAGTATSLFILIFIFMAAFVCPDSAVLWGEDPDVMHARSFWVHLFFLQAGVAQFSVLSLALSTTAGAVEQAAGTLGCAGVWALTYALWKAKLWDPIPWDEDAAAVEEAEAGAGAGAVAVGGGAGGAVRMVVHKPEEAEEKKSTGGEADDATAKGGGGGGEANHGEAGEDAEDNEPGASGEPTGPGENGTTVQAPQSFVARLLTPFKLFWEHLKPHLAERFSQIVLLCYAACMGLLWSGGEMVEQTRVMDWTTFVTATVVVVLACVFIWRDPPFQDGVMADVVTFHSQSGIIARTRASLHHSIQQLMQAEPDPPHTQMVLECLILWLFGTTLMLSQSLLYAARVSSTGYALSFAALWSACAVSVPPRVVSNITHSFTHDPPTNTARVTWLVVVCQFVGLLYCFFFLDSNYYANPSLFTQGLLLLFFNIGLHQAYQDAVALLMTAVLLNTSFLISCMQGAVDARDENSVALTEGLPLFPAAAGVAAGPTTSLVAHSTLNLEVAVTGLSIMWIGGILQVGWLVHRLRQAWPVDAREEEQQHKTMKAFSEYVLPYEKRYTGWLAPPLTTATPKSEPSGSAGEEEKKQSEEQKESKENEEKEEKEKEKEKQTGPKAKEEQEKKEAEAANANAKAKAAGGTISAATADKNNDKAVTPAKTNTLTRNRSKPGVSVTRPASRPPPVVTSHTAAAASNAGGTPNSRPRTPPSASSAHARTPQSSRSGRRSPPSANSRSAASRHSRSATSATPGRNLRSGRSNQRGAGR